MNGKICLITGGAGGIGRAIAIALQKRGAHVLVADLPDKPSPPGVSKIDVDLSTRVGVTQLLDEIHGTHDRLNVLVNNVGGIFPERIETPDGLEMTFALNHLSSFMVTLGLIDILKQSSPSLIVNVASSHHRAGRIDFEDLQGQRRYRMNKAYCQSKLANVMFTAELARRLDGSGVTTIAVHPGATNSAFGDVLPGFWGFMWRMSSPLRREPAYAGEWIAKLTSSPEASKYNGGYFAGGKKEPVSKRARDVEASKHLWSASLELSDLTTSI